MQTRLWVTGYRSFELGTFSDKDPKIEVIKRALKDNIIDQLENNELEWIITGGQMGTEQWSCETAIELKKDFPQLKIAIILPFSNFASNWNQEHQMKLIDLRSRVDFSEPLSKENYKSPIQLRNFQSFMLRHTDGALMVYDPDNPGKADFEYKAIKEYQHEHSDYFLKTIDFDMLTDISNEIEEEKRPW